MNRFKQNSKWSLMILLLLGTVCFTAQFALGDNLDASIRGVVTDPSGAAVPNVTVTATNTDTGVVTKTTSSADGNYAFAQLPIGNYRVSAQASAFKTFQTNAINLTVNEVYNLPVALEVGTTSETVEVLADSAQVETANIQLETLVGQKAIVDMPLIGRNWTALEQLSPGVVAASDRFGTYAVNGSQSNQSSYLINGVDSNDLPLNSPSIIPSPDALSEFNIITNTINPEYGRNSGAIVNTVLKNGTNQFHGNAFEFYRDTFLNTKNFLQVTTPLFHQNQFGGTLGGPIWKDHTFFFFSYQGRRFSEPEPGAGGLVSVFTPGQRTGAAGSFPDLETSTATSPFPLVGDSGVTYPGGTLYSTIFSQGFIPTADFNPISSTLLSTYVPAPNFGSGQYSFNPNRAGKSDQYIGRIDHTFNSKDAIWGTAFFEADPQTNDLPLPGGADLPGFADTVLQHYKQYIADWTHTFNGTTINEFRLGYTRFNDVADIPLKPVAPSSLGFQINPQFTGADQGLPYIQINSLFNIGFTTNGPQPRKDQTYEVTDNFSKIVGKHALKAGFDGRRFDVWNPFLGSNNGSFTFAGKGPYSTGDGGADFLLGVPDSYNQGSGGLIIGRAYESYVYLQDQWKVKPTLTVTLGAGWQVDTPLQNLQDGGKDVVCFRPGQQSAVSPGAPQDLLYPGDPGCNNAGGVNTKWGHVGPRVGFAWAPNSGWLSGGTGKLSIRGGIGYYFNRSEEESLLQNLGDPPFSLNSGGVSDLGAPGTSPGFANPYADVNPTSGVSEPNKFPFVPPPLSSLTPAQFSNFLPLALSIYDKNFSTPEAMNYNLTIQRELGQSTVVSIGYVGSLGRHLIRYQEQNPITLAGAAACAADPTCVASATNQHVAFPTHSAYPGNIFASMSAITTNGNSSYNSLQASINKKVSSGFSLQASYTYSHAIDDGSGFENTGFGGFSGINPFQQYAYLNRGDSAYDARNRFVAGYTYQTPSLHGDHRFLNMIVGDWEFSGITTFQTGFPIWISDGFDVTTLTDDYKEYYSLWDPAQQVGPIQTYNPRNSSVGGVQHVWFNPNSFTSAATGSWGNVRRDEFHGPGLNNTDFAVEKNIHFMPPHEQTYVQLRLEGYNVFNHTQFCNSGGPFPCIDGDVADKGTTFGEVLSAQPGRLVQLGAKFYF